jgi:hypothetical protein
MTKAKHQKHPGGGKKSLSKVPARPWPMPFLKAA